MRKFLGFYFAIIILALSPVPSGAVDSLMFPNPEQPISMDFQDASLKDILKIFSIQSGLNFIASESVQERKITIYMDKVAIQDAMNKLFKANGLSYDLDKESNIFIVKDWGKPQIETITKVFNLKHATVSSSALKEEMQTDMGVTTSSSSTTSGRWTSETDVGITKAVKKILSEYGSLIEDYRTNSLVITDTPSKIAVITDLIAALDVSVPQVLLEVEMLDVTKKTTEKLGFDFSDSITGTLTPASISTMFPMNPWGNAASGAGVITNGSVAGNAFSVVLDFIKTQTDTKYLARPKILTLNNETSEIKIATNEAIGINTTTTGTTASTSATAERSETGVILRVTPQVNTDTGEVTLFIYPKVSSATDTSSLTANGQSYIFKNPEERSTKSIVRVKDGETIILGGLLRHESNQVISKVPILGDIPILGRLLFTNKNKDKDTERELLVFITPRILKDSSLQLAKAEKPVILQREQNNLSVVDRQSAITSTLANVEKKRK